VRSCMFWICCKGQCCRLLLEQSSCVLRMALVMHTQGVLMAAAHPPYLLLLQSVHAFN
jgi:hypothetical protein